MKELERLQKEINGKLIWWRSSNGFLLPAICLWPPSENEISVKPYGTDTGSIKDVIPWHTNEEIEDPSFCLAQIHVWLDTDTGFVNTKHLAGVPDGCVWNPYTLLHGGNPTCPYG